MSDGFFFISDNMETMYSYFGNYEAFGMLKSEKNTIEVRAKDAQKYF